MSYEGHCEYLCAKGHYWCSQDYHSDDPDFCPSCGEAVRFWNNVDTTNGFEEDEPRSWPARKSQIGSEKKVIEIPLFRAGPDWRKMPEKKTPDDS